MRTASNWSALLATRVNANVDCANYCVAALVLDSPMHRPLRSARHAWSCRAERGQGCDKRQCSDL